ncbi:MAG: single-stranded DNA-binding protein, partial [Pseudobdellovibrionaceae bacterium]|nr:single-stranded DNA-binding protein [Pseudobdellovibrionaceae bacterium]MDQ3233876.1 single-stranded DNA-binding protein [Pseudobdellovibrionaceae bacterium]
MASINLAILIGNLGKDPQLRHTQTGTAVCTFSIATTENWTDQSGQKQSKTEWHNIVVWNKQAENCAKYLRKGRAAYVEGRVQTRSWDDTTGQKRYTTEIIAE